MDRLAFLTKCDQLCRAGGTDIPSAMKEAARAFMNVSGIPENQISDATKSKMTEILGDMYISLMLFAMYYDIDFDEVDAYIEKELTLTM